jgi:pseudouridine-5'-phosphate glycosidase
MDYVQISNEVQQALSNKKAVVALESTVITHGLPHPTNLNTALAMEAAVRAANAVPATIALMDGKIRVGLSEDELSTLASSDTAIKVSVRDIAGVISKKMTGGTTVAATMAAAMMANICVFATGGIGGVHRDTVFDISADLPMLAKTPMLVICSGAKSILDLPATREYLETQAIPVIGYQTDELPAFFSTDSGLKVDYRLEDPGEIASFAKTHWALGFFSAVLVTVPPPQDKAIDSAEIDQAISGALREAKREKVTGSAVTPYLLKKVNEATHAKSMAVNTALLKNNARIAGEIAVSLIKSAI